LTLILKTIGKEVIGTKNIKTNRTSNPAASIPPRFLPNNSIVNGGISVNQINTLGVFKVKRR